MLTSTGENVYVDTAVEAGKTYYYVLSALDANFVETPMSAEKSIEVREEKREEKREAAARKEKQKIFLRRAKLAFTVQRGPWGELAQPISSPSTPGERVLRRRLHPAENLRLPTAAGQFLSPSEPAQKTGAVVHAPRALVLTLATLDHIGNNTSPRTS